ncbi:MAG: hypothetical protein RLZZ623_473 [Actinomycetota bacterium]|jgi:Family of unknown function (DUF5318)
MSVAWGSMSASGDGNTFSAGSLRGAGRGVVDHRLARRHLINEFRRGRLRQHEVCDAHPELIRAAKNLGSESRVTCPICQQAPLRLVTYVFGSRLPSHGRCVGTAKELAALNSRSDDLTAYVVEACVECRWHHLLRVLPVGGQRRKAAGA